MLVTVLLFESLQYISWAHCRRVEAEEPQGTPSAAESHAESMESFDEDAAGALGSLLGGLRRPPVSTAGKEAAKAPAAIEGPWPTSCPEKQLHHLLVLGGQSPRGKLVGLVDCMLSSKPGQQYSAWRHGSLSLIACRRQHSDLERVASVRKDTVAVAASLKGSGAATAQWPSGGKGSPSLASLLPEGLKAVLGSMPASSALAPQRPEPQHSPFARSQPPSSIPSLRDWLQLPSSQNAGIGPVRVVLCVTPSSGSMSAKR